MDILEIRRANLRRWVTHNGTPHKEKSLFSQLKGTASFGERVARRLELEYNMGVGYLDTPIQDRSIRNKNSNFTPASGESKEVAYPMGHATHQYTWVTSEEATLLTLYRTTDDRGREEIMREAQSTPRVILSPASVDNQS